jgi:membrane associated rhomboid family serine protease
MIWSHRKILIRLIIENQRGQFFVSEVLSWPEPREIIWLCMRNQRKVQDIPSFQEIMLSENNWDLTLSKAAKAEEKISVEEGGASQPEIRKKPGPLKNKLLALKNNSTKLGEKTSGALIKKVFLVEKKSENKAFINQKSPWFIYVLGCVQFVILIAMLVFESGFESIEYNPFLGPSKNTLLYWGAKYSPSIKLNRQVYRFVTPLFLHPGLIHFLFNTMAINRIGSKLERAYGWFRVMIVCLLSCINGTLASAIFLPGSVTTSASGILYGYLLSFLNFVLYLIDFQIVRYGFC